MVDEGRSSGKRLSQRFYQTANLNIFTTNLDYFMNDFQINPINISLKSALMESSVKYESQAWQ